MAERAGDVGSISATARTQRICQIRSSPNDDISVNRGNGNHPDPDSDDSDKNAHLIPCRLLLRHYASMTQGQLETNAF